MTREGFIKLHRQLLDNPIMQNSRTFHVFVWCLLRANYKARQVRLHGADIQLRPGQFISGRFAGSSECGMHPSTFRNAIDRLKSCGAIATKQDNKKTIFTVVNWVRFQGEPLTEDNKRTTKGQQEDTDKKVRREEQREDGEQHAVPPSNDSEKKQNHVHDLITFFREKHQRIIGVAYAVQRGKDHAAAKDMIDSLGLPECQVRVVRYLGRPDKWTTAHGYSIHNMAQVINGLGDHAGPTVKGPTPTQRYFAEQEATP